MHHPHLRARFWVEVALAVSALVLGVVTLVWPDWLELVLGVDPDHGSGSLEAFISLGLMAFAGLFAVAGSVEWRRALRPSPGHRATT